MREENGTENPEAGAESAAAEAAAEVRAEPDLGKFKSVDALFREIFRAMPMEGGGF